MTSARWLGRHCSGERPGRELSVARRSCGPSRMSGLLEAGRPGRTDDAAARDLADDGAAVEVGGGAVLVRRLRGVHLTISCGGWLLGDRSNSTLELKSC